MLRNMEPPVGFGKKCPYRLAYRVGHSLEFVAVLLVVTYFQLVKSVIHLENCFDINVCSLMECQSTVCIQVVRKNTVIYLQLQPYSFVTVLHCINEG